MSDEKEVDGRYYEVLCQRALGNGAFENGVQQFIWSAQGSTSFIPSKSYLRIECAMSRARGAVATDVANQPRHSDLIAPSDNLAGALWDNVSVYMGNEDVSSLSTGVARAEALKARMTTPYDVAESSHRRLYMNDAYFKSRQDYICYDSLGNPEDIDCEEAPLTSVAANQRTATVAITGETGIVAGVNTEFATQASVGDWLVVRSSVATDSKLQRFQITSITSDILMSVTPLGAPAAAGASNIAATTYAYIVKRRKRPSEGRNTFFLMHKPCVGFFDYDQIVPAGSYRLSLNPASDYKKFAIETKLGTSALPIVDANFDFTITDVRLYIYLVRASIPSSLRDPSMIEFNVQSKPLTGDSSSLTFTVPVSSMAFSVFVQANNAGKNPLIPLSSFTTSGADKPYLGLKSLQLQYGGVTKPATKWNSGYGDLSDTLQQRYRDSYSHAKMHGVLGHETFDEWLTRGPFYHFAWVSEASSASSELQVSVDFAAALPADTNLWVVSWFSRQVSAISIDGMIQEVETRSR